MSDNYFGALPCKLSYTTPPEPQNSKIEALSGIFGCPFPYPIFGTLALTTSLSLSPNLWNYGQYVSGINERFSKEVWHFPKKMYKFAV